MAYMNKNAELKNGYNAYIDSSVDDWAPRWTWACC